LLWRVFLVNAGLIVAGVALLALTPLTISHPLTRLQALMLVVGAAIMLGANFVLLRVSMRPLRRLAARMERIDLLQPGERLEVEGARDLQAPLERFNTMLERLEHERRVSTTRIAIREEEERRRVATELHDQVGQGLTALLLQMRPVLVEAPDSLRPQLLEMQEIVRQNLDEIRRIARDLRPTVLDDLGLPAALEALADTAEGHHQIDVVRLIEEPAKRVSPSAELALYRIAQEAMTNVLRHAGARHVEIHYAANGHTSVNLAVRDNGRGMSMTPELEGGGIRGMRERALGAGADLSITSELGRGTTVSVSLEEAS
jgi:two-component system sensor histidine kinase UhpB